MPTLERSRGVGRIADAARYERALHPLMHHNF